MRKLPSRTTPAAVSSRLARTAGPCYPNPVAVARVTEIIASSPDGFREAVEEGLARAVRTLRNITGLEVVAKRVKVEHGQIAEYRVEMKVIFLLD
jgi:flavin-binding protein dodecin